MKRLFTIIAVLLFFSMTANAQFKFGGNFSIEFNDGSNIEESTSNQSKTFDVSLKPKMYYYFCDRKMYVGGRLKFSYGHLTDERSNITSDQDKAKTSKSIGWGLNPFYAYKIINWGWMSVWVEGNIGFDRYYNIDGGTSALSTWNNKTNFGAQILPVLDINLTDKLSAQLHLGLLSLGWDTTITQYTDKVTTRSAGHFRKGGIVGLVEGIVDYGIGISFKL